MHRAGLTIHAHDTRSRNRRRKSTPFFRRRFFERVMGIRRIRPRDLERKKIILHPKIENEIYVIAIGLL